MLHNISGDSEQLHFSIGYAQLLQISREVKEKKKTGETQREGSETI